MKKIIYLISILAMLSSFTASSATYYVSPLGIDSNGGTYLESPVKTIKAALAKAGINDTIYVLTGTYSETVSVDKSGITLTAYPDNKPIIDGGTTLPNSNWGVLLSINGNNNTVSGFEIKNSNITGKFTGGYGIEVKGHHNLISKMNVHHIWETGVLLGGDYNTVEDSTIWQAAYRNSTNNGSVTSGWATGISAARNRSPEAIKAGITSYATFRRNTVFNNWGEGLSCFEADYCTLEDNIVYDNWTINVYISDTSHSLVQRNLIYVSSNIAIATRKNLVPSNLTLADELTNKPRSTNNTIVNNLLFGGSFNAFSWTNVSGSGLNNVVIANNTIVNGDLIVGNSNNVSTTVANNLVIGGKLAETPKQGVTFVTNDYGSVDIKLAKLGSTNAGFLKPDYFKILSDSPVINKGTTLPSVTEDFFKVGRKGLPDIGAVEFVSTSPVPVPDPTPVPVPVPVPTPVEKNVTLSISTPISVREAIKADAKVKRLSTSKHVTNILKDYLKK